MFLETNSRLDELMTNRKQHCLAADRAFTCSDVGEARLTSLSTVRLNARKYSFETFCLHKRNIELEMLDAKQQAKLYGLRRFAFDIILLENLEVPPRLAFFLGLPQSPIEMYSCPGFCVSECPLHFRRTSFFLVSPAFKKSSKCILRLLNRLG